jgi:hypothetical protein
MFHQLLSRDYEDGRACPPSRACSLRPARHCEASAEPDGRGGRATGQPCRAIGPEAYLNATSQGELVLSVAEGTPEDARKDDHIRGRSR